MHDVKFLVVDDSKTIRNVVCKIIKNQIGSPHVNVAENGQEAKEILKSNNVDMVISDWNMPVMDGEELLYYIRNESEKKDVPFIMMTTNDNRDFIITAIQLGVSQYLVKPFTPCEMEEKIKTSWNYATKRKSMRYASLPKHAALVKMDGHDSVLPATFVNISRTGGLIKLKHREEVNLFKSCEIDLKVELSKDKVLSIDNMRGQIVRLEAENSFHPTSKTCLAALYMNPVEMDKTAQENLSKFLKWLHSRLPEMVKE